MKMQRRKDGQYRIDTAFSRIIWCGISLEQKMGRKEED